jgi:hypothetical protein
MSLQSVLRKGIVRGNGKDIAGMKDDQEGRRKSQNLPTLSHFSSSLLFSFLVLILL